jgi:hypothetical protein
VTDVQDLQNKKLEQLTRNEEPAQPEVSARETEAAKKVDLEKANEKLSGLLGKPK